MEIEFVRNRIREQVDYICDLLTSDKSQQRKAEILPSAMSQYKYFRKKLTQIIISTMSKTTTMKVADFHKTFEHPINGITEIEPLKIRQLRVKLLFEELAELAEAGDVNGTMMDLCHKYISDGLPENGEPVEDGDNVNKVEELDALCDIQYVLDGKKLTSGLHEVFDQAFDLVHQNNMNKAHTGPDHVQMTAGHLGIKLNTIERNGLFLAMNEDGKLIKPFDHKKVTLNHLIPVTENDKN